MFSIFRQASDTQDVVLKELTEEQLSEVAGGKAHHHHHHKHHHPKTGTWTTPGGTWTGTGTGTGPGMGTGTTVSDGVTYPAHSHW